MHNLKQGTSSPLRVKSESTIKQYARKVSQRQETSMSDTLATSIITKAPKITEPSVKSEAASTPVQPGPPNFDLNAMDLFPIEDNNDDILINFIQCKSEFRKLTSPSSTTKRHTTTASASTTTSRYEHSTKHPQCSKCPELCSKFTISNPKDVFPRE